MIEDFFRKFLLGIEGLLRSFAPRNDSLSYYLTVIARTTKEEEAILYSNFRIAEEDTFIFA